MAASGALLTLQRPVEAPRDHVRGATGRDVATLLIWGDYLCPYCRRLRHVIERLRHAMGDRLAYVFRHFPNERAHPGAEFASWAAEAAGRQGLFWEMHDALYEREPPLSQAEVLDAAQGIGLDMDRFARDVADDHVRARVEADLADGRLNGVSGTPTIFIDGQRYDGAWDFYSMLEAVERPIGARVQRTARAFASLPASAALVLIAAAGAALAIANTPIGPLYRQIIETRVGIDASTGSLALTVAEWCSEGLLTVFFLLVGLEIRRDMTAGALTDRRAAILPVLCAIGGTLAPAAIYLAINPGPTAPGWSAPTSTGIAFALGLLALLGHRAPTGLKVFVAALAVVDDIVSMLVLAVFYPQDFHAAWLAPAAGAVVLMAALNRWRVYAGSPYLVVTITLWLSLHASGVNAALAGVALAIFLPTRPAPAAGPLLAQAATALAALEHAQNEAREAGSRAAANDTAPAELEPVWDWASRNLSAASARLLSPADRVERAVAPWAAYVVLPLFAFSATGVPLAVDLRSPGVPQVMLGVVLGLLVGKPVGIGLTALALVKTRIAVLPEDTTRRAFLGGALLCGVSDPVGLLMADSAFPHGGFAAAAKIGVLSGSVLAAALGMAVLATSPPPITPVKAGDA